DIGAADSTPPLAAAVSPERSVQMPASRKATPARLNSESPVPAASPGDLRGPRSFIRQSPNSAPPSSQSDNQPDPREHESKGVAAEPRLLSPTSLCAAKRKRTRVEANHRRRRGLRITKRPAMCQISLSKN